MSEDDPIDLSARDLMAGWLDDLDNPEKIAKNYADHEGGEGKRGRGKGGSRDGGRGRSPGGGGRSSFGGGGGGGSGRRPGGDRDGKGRSEGPRRGGGDGGRGRGRDRRDEERRPAAPARIEGLDVALLLEKSAIESIAKYVRTMGRAYPMWDIARTMLASRERYRIGFRKSQDAGDAAPDLVRCSLDDSFWLTREEALQHVVRSGLLSKYYRIDVVEVEPPKGNFTAIAVHRKSGTVLGPPNHHEYRVNLMKLHQKRFSHVPFDRFSKEIEMKRDEETIEAWKESKTKVRHFVHVGLEGSCLSSDESSEGLPKEEAGTAKNDQQSAISDQPADAEAGGPAVMVAPSAEASEAEEAVISEEASAAEEVAVVEEAPSEREAPAAEEGPASEEAAAEEDLDEVEVEVSVSEEVSADGEAPVEDSVAEEVAEEVPAADVVVLKSEEEAAKHFRETYGDVVFFPVSKFFVPGNIKGSQLSRGLLALLRDEVETKQKSPMTLIQNLCRGLEKHGMKFFKEGRKMFVTAARPRGLDEGVVIADAPMKLLKFVEENEGTTVMNMMAGLVPGVEAPTKGEAVKDHKPTTEQMQFVSDIRWLTSEGYLVEYSTGKVRLGSHKPGGGGGAKGDRKKGAKGGKKGEGERGASDMPKEVSTQGPNESEGETAGEENPVAEDAPVVDEAPTGTDAPVEEDVVDEASAVDEALLVEEAPIAEEGVAKAREEEVAASEPAVEKGKASDAEEPAPEKEAG